MSVDGWERTPNALILGTLSDRALGVWVRMRARQGLGEPLSAEALAGPGREGRDARRAAMRELAAAGLLHTLDVPDAGRQLRKVTRVYDEPTPVDVARADILERAPKTGSQASGERAPKTGSQATDFQGGKTYIPTTTNPLPPTHPKTGSQASEIQGSGRRPIPTCPTCREDHYPEAVCSETALLLPVVVAAQRQGDPHRGRRHWAFVASARQG